MWNGYIFVAVVANIHQRELFWLQLGQIVTKAAGDSILIVFPNELTRPQWLVDLFQLFFSWWNYGQCSAGWSVMIWPLLTRLSRRKIGKSVGEDMTGRHERDHRIVQGHKLCLAEFISSTILCCENCMPYNIGPCSFFSHFFQSFSIVPIDELMRQEFISSYQYSGFQLSIESSISLQFCFHALSYFCAMVADMIWYEYMIYHCMCACKCMCVICLV